LQLQEKANPEYKGKADNTPLPGIGTLERPFFIPDKTIEKAGNVSRDIRHNIRISKYFHHQPNNQK
jgi:hypothetical protein